MDEVYDILTEERDHINVSFTVNDLNHLQRGGRVEDDGGCRKPGQHQADPESDGGRGTEVRRDSERTQKSLKTLVSRMEATLDLEHYGKDRMVAVLHGDCIDEAKNVADMVKELGFTNVIINDVSRASEPMQFGRCGTCSLRTEAIKRIPKIK